VGVTKRCAMCMEDLPLGEFRRNGRYLHSYCRPCNRRRWRDREKLRAERRRREAAQELTYCRRCCDLPHRRPRDRACACGRKYVARGAPRIDGTGRSSAGQWYMGGSSDG